MQSARFFDFLFSRKNADSFGIREKIHAVQLSAQLKYIAEHIRNIEIFIDESLFFVYSNC